VSALRVAVLVPPQPPSAHADLDDTYVQAAEISQCLAGLGDDPLAMFFDADHEATAAKLAALAPSLVFNLVEDLPEGPDQVHLVTALLERLGLRFTGASTAALAALADKTRMKAVLKSAGLPVAPGLEQGDQTTPYIVKSAIEHASVGIDASSVVFGRDAAMALIAQKQVSRGGLWFAEHYIDGREFNVSVLQTLDGPLVLPVAEILFTNHTDGRAKIVGYAEKWQAQSDAYEATPRVFPSDADDQSLLLELGQLALQAWHLFGLTGYARVDFRVDASGKPCILEINANPCLTADAGFCAAGAQIGMSQTDVIAHIVTSALA
jgi:D-alanine-D-alanine ligase